MTKVQCAGRFFACASLSSVFSFLLVACSTPLVPPQLGDRMIEYTGRSVDFKITYPQSWILYELPQGNHGDKTVIAGIAKKEFFSLGIQVYIYRSLATLDSLEEVANWGTAVIAKYDDDQTQHAETLLVGNRQTLLREWVYVNPATPVAPAIRRRCIDDYQLFKDRGYILSLCADDSEFSQFKPIFLRMISSFSIQNP